MQRSFNKLVRLLGVCLIALMTSTSFIPLSLLADGLLTNPGFNDPFIDIPGRVWHNFNESTAQGWNPFYIEDGTYAADEDAKKLHWMSSKQFGDAFGGLDYHIEGNRAQNMWSSYDMNAGVYQKINGVTPGQIYQFDIKMVTYWRGPGYPDSDGLMEKQVGIDPYGGVDAAGPNVIWGDTDSNDKFWSGMKAAATAESGSITVFAKVKAPDNNNHTDLNMVYFEDSSLNQIGLGPTTIITASSSITTINVNWSGSVDSGWSVTGYQVRYQDQAEGTWITLQDKNGTDLSGSFTGQSAHTYIIQARTWQTDGSINVPGQWAATTIFVGEAITGRVFNHIGAGLNGVTLSSVDVPTTTVSANGGYYTLPTGSPGTFRVTAANVDGLLAPPTSTVVVNLNELNTLNITLRPTGTHQALTNNDFEIPLAGSLWQVSHTDAATLGANAGHSGNYGLLISNTVNISQTGVITAFEAPVLSFWHKNNISFTVDFLGNALTPAQSRTVPPVSKWSHFILYLDAGDVYTGNIGVNFAYTDGLGANIAIDEVSIAAGLRYRNYLPILLKNQ